MAKKALLFLSIFLLVLSTTVFAKEEGADDKKREGKGVESKKENVGAKDEKAPAAQPSGDAAAVAAAKPQGQDGNIKCQPLCQELCKGHRRKRPCVRACTACCKKSKCVPMGEKKKCSNWDTVILAGSVTVKCPIAK